jgi:hypothetical protein
MKFKQLAIAAAIAASSVAPGIAQAAPVTWGVSASVNGASIVGTVAFDDATVQGCYDGINDPNDTHVAATWVLSSAALGWVNEVFDQTAWVAFQPYYYSSYNDGPHNDIDFQANGYSLSLGDMPYSYAYNINTGDYSQGTWSLDRNAVPIPATLPLMGLGLAMLAFARRKTTE